MPTHTPAHRSAARKGAAPSLARYWAKRNFKQTPEPRGAEARPRRQLSFVIQKHDATRLHYDFRLELDGVLLSWAVPKGPSFDPHDKRMAVRTEDHPLSYARFEGTIPPRQYGAGTVIVWDRGTWEPAGDPHEGLAKGKLAFTLHGEKLAGQWELVRMRPRADERQEAWLLFKKHDAHARDRTDYDVVSALPDSVLNPPEAPQGQPKKRTSKAQAPSGSAMAAAGAVKAPLPQTLSPQLATLASDVPPTGRWIYEVKFDGYRLLARIERGVPRLFTRNGHDWTDKMPALARELKSLGVGSAWVDGEIVVPARNGLPDFNALQNAFDHSRTGSIVYFVFDLPYFEGHDLRQVPLHARRDLLRRLMAERGTDHLRFSEDFEAPPQRILQSACDMHLEGVIAKRADAPYENRRSGSWLKLKCQPQQEFVIGGYTDRSDGSQGVGSLLLGVHDAQGRLAFCGGVGTGWNAEEAVALKKRLARLKVDELPFAAETVPKAGRWTVRSKGHEHWVKPSLVAQVKFAEWTPDGQIRHASFEGLREDKPARAIIREEKATPAAQTKATAPRKAKNTRNAAGVSISHPERVIDPSTGITKLELVRYYESVADWMLPHLKGRPCSLVRGPEGIARQLFFQKHPDKIHVPGVRELDPALWPDHDPLLEIANVKALVSATQMNTVEFHTWGARIPRLGKPDRMVFDVDPGEGVPWSEVQEATLLVRSMLDELGLESWLKTSGGKGLHVVVPLAARHDWDTVRGFSQAVVQHLARVIPKRFVAKSGPRNRVGKIFVDYLRNGEGATTAAAYSARARAGMGVSMPIGWEQLSGLKSSAHWTVRTARDHLSLHAEDPWKGYWKTRQTLTAAMKKLGYRPGSQG